METENHLLNKNLPAKEEVEAPSQAWDDSSILACNTTRTRYNMLTTIKTHDQLVEEYNNEEQSPRTTKIYVNIKAYKRNIN